MEQQPAQKRINILEIIIFYLVAVAVSAPFRLGLVNLNELLPLPYGLGLFFTVLRGIGPLAGFLVVVYLLNSRVERRISFLGVNPLFSLLAITMIIAGLSIAGVNNNLELNPHYFGFLTGIILTLYAIGEEYGWRGYLQQALRGIPVFLQILIIAIMWYAWHLNFLRAGVSLQTHLIHFGALVAGSWGLMKVADTTFSLLFVVAVHLSFNIFSDISMESTGKVSVIVASAIVWTLLIVTIERRKKQYEVRGR